MSAKGPITCHVLDTVAGKPAQGVTVQLDELSSDGFKTLSTSVTNSDGRCLDLYKSGPKAEKGTYKITFFTQKYFEAQSTTSFFPFVEITFNLTDPEAHYHVPLLLSPYSYTTYRGS